MRAFLFITILAGTGCLRTTTYKCETDTQCGTGGACEITGFCSFADPSCAGMGDRRYGDQSGVYANKCTATPITQEDASVTDTPVVDTPMTDVPITSNCAASYTTVGALAHRYRVITGQNDWTAQRNACDADTGTSYLFVPDDQAELTAVLAAAGGDTWVGVNDMANEGTYVTANGGTLAANSALWDGGEPDNGPEMGTGNNNSHCVMGKPGTNRLSDDKCQNTYVAVCECEP